VVPKREARTWTMQAGDLCRVTVHEGSQVGDMNFWNLENTAERFYSGKTRQLHSSHLRVYDRLWSCLPHLRPMATFVFDSLASYGIDEDGGALHDVIVSHLQTPPVPERDLAEPQLSGAWHVHCLPRDGAILSAEGGPGTTTAATGVLLEGAAHLAGGAAGEDRERATIQ